MVMVMDTGRRTSVAPFHEDYEPIPDIPIATCATAYDCPDTGTTYLLLFGEALYFGDELDHSLICPNQVRAAGHTFDDVPLQYRGTHSMTLTDDDDGQPPLTIPFALDGVFSVFPTRKPTDSELTDGLPTFFATSEGQWEPNEFLIGKRCHHPISEVRIAAGSIDFPAQLDGLSRLSLRDGGDNWVADTQTTADKPTSAIFSMKTKGTKPPISPEALASKWGIGLEMARKTVKTTTQKGVRTVQHPVHKRFQSQPYHRKALRPGMWYSDTAFFKTNSINGQTCAQVTGNGSGYTRFWPMRSKKDCSDGLVDFINREGIPETLVVDGSKEQGHPLTYDTAWMKVVRKYHIKQSITEPYSWWQNMIEGDIREVKREMKTFRNKKASPMRLWNYLGEYVTRKRSMTTMQNPNLQGRTPYQAVHGCEPDLSMYAKFGWYDWVYYLDKDHEQQLARWIGVAEDIGSGDCHHLLPVSCKPIARSTVWHIPEEDKHSEEKKQERKAFDEAVKQKIGDQISNQDGTEYDFDINDFLEMEGDDYDVLDEPSEPESSIQEIDDYTPDSYDEYLTAEVLLPVGDERMRGVVRRRVKDADGMPLGKRNSNPLLDTRTYEVEMPDGSTEQFAANIIAESMYSQIDDEGKHYLLLSEIMDHRAGKDAIKKDDGFITTATGQIRPKVTTKGWKLLVQWKDGTSTWVKLSDMKESYPVETAEYALNNKILEEPAFAWWAKQCLRKKERIIAKVKSKYWAKTHKYGIRVPKTVAEALRIDEDTKTDYWSKAIEKEMKNVRVAFEFTDGDKVPVGHELLTVHMVFDIKLSLDRKARLVADGHKTNDQASEHTFSSVVSRDSVRIFFLLAALNDLDVLSADIQNAYLTAPLTRERFYIIAGDEFGSDKGRPAKVVRALYGLKTSGRTFRLHLADTLKTLGYKSCRADPDVWFREAKKPDGEAYYEYMLCYVDDVIGCSHMVKEMFNDVGARFKFKSPGAEPPTQYLGADITKFYIEESDNPAKIRWGMSSTNYTKKAIKEVERELAEAGLFLATKAPTPIASGYRPELDTSPELDATRLNYYQGLIGILRWICELGRMDIQMPVSLLSRYLVSARRGHMEQVFHIFAYLKTHERSTLVFDDTVPDIPLHRFVRADWTEYYPDATEKLPPDAPAPRGREVTTTCFVDADHAGCQATRRSHTGVIILVNRAPILWYSKRQNTVETSTYGSEIIALKIAVEMVEGLRYKLRMMGVPLDGPTKVMCDNESVVRNTTRPESPLKKKSNSISFHKIRESISNETIMLGKEDGETNLADLLTKLLNGPKIRDLAGRLLW